MGHAWGMGRLAREITVHDMTIEDIGTCTQTVRELAEGVHAGRWGFGFHIEKDIQRLLPG